MKTLQDLIDYVEKYNIPSDAPLLMRHVSVGAPDHVDVIGQKDGGLLLTRLPKVVKRDYKTSS